jgi:hypothetical protein
MFDCVLLFVASNERQILVKKLIDNLEAMGLTILCAAYTGYHECPKQGRHKPDVVAKDPTGLVYIGEAKTCESIFSFDTGEQFQDFSNRVMPDDKRKIPFYIAIPKVCEEDLLQALEDLGITSRKNIHFYLF